LVGNEVGDLVGELVVGESVVGEDVGGVGGVGAVGEWVGKAVGDFVVDVGDFVGDVGDDVGLVGEDVVVGVAVVGDGVRKSDNMIHAYLGFVLSQN
jgi:hypothetical protein